MGKRGRKHEKTEDKQDVVKRMAIAGIQQALIAECLDCSVDTLNKYYKEELITSSAKANANVAAKLYQQCMEGNTAALIFWCKTKLKWRETFEIDMTQRTITDKPMSNEEWIAKYAKSTDAIDVEH